MAYWSESRAGSLKPVVVLRKFGWLGSGQGWKLGIGWQGLGKLDCHRPGAGADTRPRHYVCGLNGLAVHDSLDYVVRKAGCWGTCPSQQAMAELEENPWS